MAQEGNIYTPTKDFFVQRMSVEDIKISREEYFMNLMSGQSVLHVGCVDSPVFNPNNNLHIRLGKSGRLKRLDGCDIDAAGLETLAHHYAGTYFTGIDNVKDTYDWVLVPEVIEHVPNIAEFVKSLTNIKTTKILITSPNVEGCVAAGFFNARHPEYIETVHPDHNVWFSPYTLMNAVGRYSDWKVESVFVLNSRRSTGVIISK